MPYLSLSLLGPFQAWNVNGSMKSFRTIKERALLSYLVVENGRVHRRDALAELFWPDRPEGVARNNLRQALYGIRQAIGEAGFEAIFSVTGEDVQVNISDGIWLDLTAYNIHLKASQEHNHEVSGPCPSCMQHLRDAVELYRGSFLEDVTLDNNQEFQDWLEFHRDQFLRLQIQALEVLVLEFERMGDYTQAIEYAENLTRLDDLKESLSRRLMTLLAKAGRGGAALEWFETYQRKAQDLFGTPPSEDLMELARQIRLGQFEPGPAIVAAAPHNLPEHLTPFIGREMELSRLAQLMSSAGCRLISIVGLGGVGKTRLAVQATKMVLRQFPDGIYFISLETVASPEQLIESIGQGLGLVPGAKQDMRTVLLGYLRLKHILLILDNFEHLQESKGVLLEILQAAPFAKILVTSRERLLLQAESLVELGGLPFPTAMPNDEEAPLMRPPQSFAAVQLFLERAGRVLHSGPSNNHQGAHLSNNGDGELPTPDAHEMDAVVRICQMVDGLPLGIELAASLARDYSFSQIATEVQHSLDFLSSSLQDLPERQRSLRVSFEHSWDLLPESEREVFTRLAVFPGSFSSSAAQVIAGAAMPWLMRLSDRSLIRRSTFGRYDLHPLIRQYAGQKLRQFSRRIEDQAQQQHAEYFCNFLKEREQALRGLRQAEALREIEVDLENVLAAWDWAVEHGAFNLLQGAAFSLMYFMESRTRWQAGEARFGHSVEVLAPLAATPSARHVLGLLNASWGWFSCRLTNFQQAESHLLQALDLLSDLDMSIERVFAHFTLGFLYVWMGRFKDAWAHLSTSQSISEQNRDPWGAAWASEILAEIAFESGQSGFSEKPFLQTLAQFERIGELRGSSRALNYLGNIALGLGQYQAARAYFERMLAQVEKAGDVWGAAGGYTKLGQLASEAKEYQQAWRLHRRSLVMFQKMGDQRRSAYALRALAEASYGLGQISEAKEYFRQSLEISARLQNISLAQDALTGLAAVHLQAGKAEQAGSLLALVLSEPVIDQLTANRAEHLRATLQVDPVESQNEYSDGQDHEQSLWSVVDGFLRNGVQF